MKESQKDRLSKLSVWIVCLALLAGLLVLASVGLFAPFNELTNTNQVVSPDGVVECHYDRDLEAVVPFFAVLVWLVTALIMMVCRITEAWISLKPLWWLTLFASS